MEIKDIIGLDVHVIIDRPFGSRHPKFEHLVYPLNYGYIKAFKGGDNDYQDAYVLGVNKPLKIFDGKVIAIIERLNDNENKWIVAGENQVFTDEDVLHMVDFQERYFKIKLIR